MERLIISRKGFDSGRGNGRCASPIFPDGTMFSLPIPSRSWEPLTLYGDIWHGDINIGDVVEDLTHGRVTRDCIAHFGPDINRAALGQRHPDWKGLLGQSGSAQGVLRNRRVGTGDLFLFFGWFKHVEWSDGHWRYVPGSPDLHTLWGWLSIGDIRKVDDIPDDDPLVDWALRHPDMVGGDSTNTIYVADDGLGSGVFPRFRESLRLTTPASARRSDWRLPRWFYPFFRGRRREPLSGFPDRGHWDYDRHWAYAYHVGPGQEFVLDTTAYPEAEGWALSLIELSRESETTA